LERPTVGGLRGREAKGGLGILETMHATGRGNTEFVMRGIIFFCNGGNVRERGGNLGNHISFEQLEINSFSGQLTATIKGGEYALL